MNASHPTAVQLHDMAPAELTTSRNIRSDLDLDDAFRASIRQLGVLSPIVADPTTDGGLLIPPATGEPQR